jgi:haloalkane dehalogenase
LHYLEAFIEVLGLRNLTLVVHDWGSALGFAYAARHPDNIRAIAFMEAMIRPFTTPEDVSPVFAPLLIQFRDPMLGRRLLIEQNLFVEQLLPAAVLRPLTEEELAAYREPFLEPASREPVWRWPNEIPIGGEPADNHALFEEFSAYLRTSEVPKLWLYATPGILLEPGDRDSILRDLPNTEAVAVGAGLHFIQEDQPDAIGTAIAAWSGRLAAPRAAVGRP